MCEYIQRAVAAGSIHEIREIDLGVEVDVDTTGWALCAGYLMVFFFMSHWAQLAVVLLSGGSVANLMVRLGFRNFSICQIRREISRNFTEISVRLNSVCTFHYLMVAQFK